MASSGPETPLDRVLGSKVLLRYVGRPQLWHAGIVMGWVGGDYNRCDVIILLTPNGAMYPQDVGPAAVINHGGDVEFVRERPADNSIPWRVPADSVYVFAPQPTSANLLARLVEAQQLCDAEILRLGWRRPQPAVAFVNVPPALALEGPSVVAPPGPGDFVVPPPLVLAKLQPQDAGVSVYRLATKGIEVMAYYDQWIVGSLASAETLCRHIRNQEGR